MPTDGSDYEGGNFSATFPAGVNVASFNVTIINDTILYICMQYMSYNRVHTNRNMMSVLS